VSDFVASWADTAGAQHTTNVVVADGAPTKPYVVLLHGASGTAADMVTPLTGPHAGLLFDDRSPVPAMIDRGWHDYPNAGFWSVGSLDGPSHGTGWQPYLAAREFGTVLYDQVEPTGLLANPVRQLHGVIDGYRQLLPGRGFAIVADSRGGLLARRWLADLAPGSPQRQDLRGIVTLHTPHQGTGLATDANAAVAALAALSAQIPALAPVATRLTYEIRTPDLIEMAPGSAFLEQLAADEKTQEVPGTTRFFTFGGNSPRLVRVRNWAFTADSAVPHVISVWPPKVQFHWTTVPQPLASLADGTPTLGSLVPEFKDGVGDLLVTDTNSHLPWAEQNVTNAMSHADTLVNETLQDQVLNVLASLPS
jgi:hypothetical protein